MSPQFLFQAQEGKEGPGLKNENSNMFLRGMPLPELVLCNKLDVKGFKISLHTYGSVHIFPDHCG